MADERGRGLPPPREPRDENSFLPPVNVDGDDRSRSYQPRMSLPPIQDHAGGAPGYGHPPPLHAHYPQPQPMDPRDPRGSVNYGPSPAMANGYSRPGPPPAPGQTGQYLPPVDQRPGQYHPAAGPPDAYGRPQGPPGQYAPQGQYHYAQHPNQAPPGYADMRGGYPGQPQLQAGAPRQRTSIACKYCRRRKIRCSGYQNAPGGKCSNCVKMNQDCVFQPVSSSTSTAFVPVTALQGTIPPGTQLYGAYGQPLPGGQGPPHPGHYPTTASEYPHAMQSPSAPYPPAPYESDRRRPRDDEALPPRLPPPHHYQQDQDPRRRSPATSSTNSPGAATYSSYPPPGGNYEGGGSTPTQRASPGGGTPNQGAVNGVMSLSNVMDAPSGSSIDQNMLSRLNRPPR
ncbi:hypothetical protein MKZ38_002921 [Zalerion maritima]|uniref:Zn(2)-C6 fungal-type domain-containing protein n=1 Tax=Zalerion maritima TaxID=339359 RepID=A0AAD5WSQ0_9PEZI|nr:hypothetical protein MKZ38_002921 [Zalerion maritima]